MKNSCSKFDRRKFIKTTALAGLGLGIAKSYGFANVEKGKRIGLIGLDSSHCVAFTKVINNPEANSEYLGYKVIAAYPRGSLDIESSVSRIPGYTEDMRKFGVEIVDSIDELLGKVDVMYMITNDGRRHLEQSLPVFKAGTRMYIDKPLAASLKDAMDIFAAAEHYNVPVFSCSIDRFQEIHEELAEGKVGEVIGADVYSPAPIEKTHPTLFWYGIHGVETLCTIMGRGCISVTRIFNDDMDISVGVWPGNRIGVYRATRVGPRNRGGTVFGEKSIISFRRGFSGSERNVFPPYKKMIDFFETGLIPVSPEDTLEVLAFMEAADESKMHNRKEVKLETVMNRARNARDRLKLDKLNNPVK